MSCANEFLAPFGTDAPCRRAGNLADRFDDHGEWMDGWETRRRRDGGHDHAVIKLAAHGRLLGFDVGTAHFTGNYAPTRKIEALSLAPCIDPGDDTRWVQVLRHSAFGTIAHHFFKWDSFESWTHLRLHIYPDGGVARLPVFDVPELDGTVGGRDIDLGTLLNEGNPGPSDANHSDYA